MMADSVQTGPYEILIRYNCDKGEKFGQIRGCHRVMMSYLVNEAGVITGRIDTGEQAEDFPAEEIRRILGEQFATFNTQLEEMRATLLEKEAELANRAGKLGDKEAELNMTKATLSQREEALLQLARQNDAMARQIEAMKNPEA